MKKYNLLSTVAGVLALISLSANAANVLVIGGEGDSHVGVKAELEAKGHTVTIQSGTSGPGDLTGFQQVWDMRYSTALSAADKAKYDDFLKNRGYLYLSGEHAGFAVRNNSISEFTSTLGGGTISVGGSPSNGQSGNGTYFPNGETVDFAAAAEITNVGGTGRILASDNTGKATAMMWIGNAGDLGQAYNGTVVVIADINWTQSAFLDTNNRAFLQQLIAGIAAGTNAGTISNAGNGAGGGNQGPTVVSTAPGPDVITIVSTRGTTTTNTQTTRGVTNTVIATSYTPTKRDAILSVNRNITATATTPVTTTVTRTTPITTVTTTTPTTIQTMSDNTTNTVVGTPVAVTTTTNEVITTPTTANEIIVASEDNIFTTRIDQMKKLDKINTLQNENSLADPLSRNKIIKDKIVNRNEPTKQSQVYVTGYSSRSGTQDTYKYTTNMIGIGYEQKYTDSLLFGLQLNASTTDLKGDASGGELRKYAIDFFALKSYEDWLLKTNFGISYNEFESYHFMRGLNLSNMAETSGSDVWLVNRVYTPDTYGFRPFAGIKFEYDYRKSVFESGSELTAVNHATRKDFMTSGHMGLRYEQEIVDDLTAVAEGTLESNKTKSIFAGFNYIFDPSTSLMLKYAIQEKENVLNNIIGAQIRIAF